MSNTNKIMEILTLKAREERLPLKVNFELLPVCNLNCKMCYIRSSWSEVHRLGGLKTVDEWLAIARQMKEEGTLFVLLTGGEVFLYPEFKRLYIELHKMGFILTINTNATMIHENTIKWLKQYPPKCISISLYGSSNETYEKLCGQKNIFTQVDRAITLLLENHITIECKTIITPYNYKDLQNIYEYTKKRNINYESSVYSFPSIRKICHEENIRFTPQEAVKCIFYRNHMMSHHEDYTKEIIKHLKKYENTKAISGKINHGLNCSACHTSCWINWKGQMLSCALLPIPYTLPLKKGFKKSWNDLKQQTDNILLSTTCSYCDKRQVCSVCPASAYAETGQFNGTSQYHCEMTELLLKEMQEYIKKENINLNEYDKNGEKIC